MDINNLQMTPFLLYINQKYVTTSKIFHWVQKMFHKDILKGGHIEWLDSRPILSEWSNIFLRL